MTLIADIDERLTRKRSPVPVRGVLETFKHTLGIDVGQTMSSRLFSLEVVRCLGACGLAPTCLVDNTVHQSIKPNNIPVILQKYE